MFQHFFLTVLKPFDLLESTDNFLERNMPLRISRSALNSPHKKEQPLVNIITKVGSVDDRQSSNDDDDADDSFTCED